MYINIVFAEYFVYIGTGATQLLGKPCHGMSLLTKLLFDKLSYVHYAIKKA